MAWQPDVNVFVATGKDAWGALMWRVWKLLIANGWTAMGSGDGRTTYQNNGDTAGPYDVLSVDPLPYAMESGVDGCFCNTEAWFRVQHPSSTLEFQVKRTNSSFSGYQFVMAIDVLGFVNTGIANANTPPTGNKTIFFNNAANWTNYQTHFYGAAEDKRIHCVVNDASVNGFRSFWFAITKAGASDVRGGGFFSAVNEPCTGDTQAWVAQMTQTNGWCTPVNGISREDNNGPKGWFDYGGGGEIQTEFPGLYYASQTGQTIPSFQGAGSDSKYRHWPIIHASKDSGLYKGISATAKWKSANGRNYPDTFDLASGNPRVVIGDLALPWKTGETPL
jgi:hypothetical protein